MPKLDKAKRDKAKRDELRALEAEILPGEWSTRWDGTLGRADVSRQGLRIHIHRAGYGNVAPEGKFIAAARNALPDLLDDLNEAEREIELLRRVEEAARRIDIETARRVGLTTIREAIAALDAWRKERGR